MATQSDSGALQARRHGIPRGLIVVGALGFLSLVSFLWIAQRSDGLAKFVSPPIDAEGRRIRALVPVGWRVYASGKSGKSSYVTLVPAKPLAWLPDWIRSKLPLKEEPLAFLILVARSGSRDNQNHETVGTAIELGMTFHSAWRSWRPPGSPYELTVDYHRKDEGAFRRTCRAICHSVTIRP